jgi:hypothetical protein
MGKDAPLHASKSRTSGPMTSETGDKNTNPNRASTLEPNTPSATSTSSTGTSAGNNNNGASDSKTFEFVLVTDAESRRQVRRHAMRQYMRQRRQDSIARLEPPRVSAGSWSASTSPAESSPRPSKLQEIEGDDVQVKREAALSGKYPVTDIGNAVGAATTVSALGKFSFSDPMAVPGSPAIYDPFNSYPIAMNPADHSLIHHCESTRISIRTLLHMPKTRCPLHRSIPSNT